MQHLERNLITFQKIFTDFSIPETEYQLLAGFDEDRIRSRIGYLNQIHVLLFSEPQNMDRFLLHLSQVLENFTAVIFTNKSTYHLPSDPDKFRKIAHASTAYGLSTLSRLSQNADIGGSLNIGHSSGQGDNGRDGPDNSRKNGKERESEDPPILPDSGKEGNNDPDPKSPGPDGDQSADVSFRVSANLHQHDVLFQTLQVSGALKIKVCICSWVQFYLPYSSNIIEDT